MRGAGSGLKSNVRGVRGAGSRPSRIKGAATLDLEREILLRASAFGWVASGRIRVQSGPFLLVGHEYQADWLIERHPLQSFRKGAQLGCTDVQVLKTMHGLIEAFYPQGALYLFPTTDDVTDFSKARFNPLIEENPEEIGRYVQNTDAAQIKKIRKAFLYLRGARATAKVQGAKKTSSKLKSVPVDRIVFDERDEMDPAMVRLAEERTAHSQLNQGLGEKVALSTPTIPDWGIDKAYNESDQRIWVIKCQKCGGYTCLETEFPSSLERLPDGRVIRICTKCRDSEIFPMHGRWVAQYPSRSKDHVGWWISQLNSIFKDPATILNEFENPESDEHLAEVYNSNLGMAWIPTENRLTQNQVLSCCGNDATAGSDTGPCAMGVDVGKVLNVVIGKVPFKGGAKVVKVARVSSFQDAYDLAMRFNVQFAIFDALPETRKVLDFRAMANFPVFGCYYNENARSGATWKEVWNEQNGSVSVNRTTICDGSHDYVSTSGRFELPRKDTEIVDFYAPQMCNIAKVKETDPETSAITFRYRALGADHYRHATNYFILAAEKLGKTAMGGQWVEPQPFRDEDYRWV